MPNSAQTPPAARSASQPLIKQGQPPADSPQVPVAIVGAGACGLVTALGLRDAGVDMEQPEPVNRAFERFGRLVDELEKAMA